MFKELKGMDIGIIYKLFEQIKNIKINEEFFDKKNTLIIYSEKDLEFIKNQSIYLEKKGFKTIKIPKQGHRHFFFDVEKSAPQIINFLK
ncbi:MAG: hypothetical protein Fur009_5310 [Candidatus Microgenomates bacterium]